jgi:hypothetical protein
MIAIITRANAKAAGLKRYFTGKPCKQGHIAETLVSSQTCCVCSAEKIKAWALNNPDRARAASRAYFAANRDRVKSRHKAWRADNPDYERKYRVANRDKQRDQARARYAGNREKEREISRNRRAADPEKARVGVRAWRAANPGKGPAATKAWAEANPEAVSVRRSRRRAWQRNAAGSHIASDLVAILKAQKYRCGYCSASSLATFARP